MESKLNHKAINAYSEQFSENLMKEFFKEKAYITGPEILELFEVKQVNLFILQYIFETWKQEMEKIKSPYFDYENEKVKQSLEAFMNLLSQNIKIAKNDFRPLLLQSVKDTILLISSPYDYYHERLKTQGKDKIQLTTLKENSRYVKINKHLHQALIDQLESKNETAINSNQTVQYLDQVIAKISAPPEDFEEYEAKFSKIAPLEVNKFYEETPQKQEYKEEVKPVELSQEQLKTVNEKFFKESKTLMDEIVVEKKTSLAELHQNKKISSIRQHITINQRFMFVNELFAGDTNAFNSALEGVESKEDYDSALDYLISEYAKPNHWVMDSEEVEEFLDVVSKRFD